MPDELFGRNLIALETQHLLYTVTVLVLMATYMIAWWITRSRFGRLLVAVYGILALAEDRGLVFMPGYLLMYHPAVAKLKELIDAGDLGDVLYLYGNRQNLGQIRRDENALWSLGAHDLSVMLYLVD